MIQKLLMSNNYRAESDAIPHQVRDRLHRDATCSLADNKK